MNFTKDEDGQYNQSPALTVNQLAPGFIIVPGIVGNSLAMVTILSSKMLRQRYVRYGQKKVQVLHEHVFTNFSL